MSDEDFGRYLAQQRQLRGLTRDDVSRATKIPLSVLVALENGQTERMPARVFVLNYIRAYAQVVGLSADETILRFQEIAPIATDDEPQSEGAGGGPGRGRLRLLKVAMALGAAGISWGAWLVIKGNDQAPAPEGVPTSGDSRDLRAPISSPPKSQTPASAGASEVRTSSAGD